MAAYSSKFIFWDPVIFLAILNIYVFLFLCCFMLDFPHAFKCFCNYAHHFSIFFCHNFIIFPCKPYNMIAKHCRLKRYKNGQNGHVDKLLARHLKLTNNFGEMTNIISLRIHASPRSRLVVSIIVTSC